MLYRYINPVCGGPDGKGWPFGRGISLSEVYAVVQQAANVDHVEEARLFPVDPETGERQEATTQVSVAHDSLLCSHKHEIAVAE
jgi:hypothetical protein